MSLISNTGTAGFGPTSSIDTTGARTIVVALVNLVSGQPPVGVTDNKSNTNWRLIQARSGSSMRTQLWVCVDPVSVGSGHTFTGTTGGGSTFPSICVAAFSEVIDFVDGSSENSATGTSIQPGSVTPTKNDSLLIAVNAVDGAGTNSVDSSFSITNAVAYGASVNFGLALAYKKLSTPAANNPTWSWSPSHPAVSTLAALSSGGDLGDSGQIHVNVNTTTDTGLTNVLNFFGFARLFGSSQTVSQVVAVGFTLRNWYLSLSVAPGSGKSRRFCIQKNGSDTALVIYLSDSSTTGSVTGLFSGVHFAAGDLIAMTEIEASAPAAATVRMAYEVKADTPGQYIYGYGTLSDSPTFVGGGGFGGQSNAWALSTAQSTKAVMGVSGTITAIAHRERTAPGGAGSRVCTFYKNGVKQDGSGGTVNTTTTLSGSNTTVIGTFSLPVVAGDLIQLEIAPSGSPAASTWQCGTVVFVPDDSSRMLYYASAAGMGAPGAPAYWYVSGSASPGWTTGSDSGFDAPGHGSINVRIIGMRVALSATPGTGATRTVTLRKNGADTPITVTIDDTGSTGAMTHDPITIANGDLWNLVSYSTGSPGSTSQNSSVVLIGEITEAVNVPPLPIAPPDAPQAPCDPEAQVSNGGKGNAGCATGGVGWGSNYAGDYGTVPEHADPTDGETLTDKDVDVWVELDVISYPSSTLTTYRRAICEISPPDVSTYYGGRKPSGLLAVGEIEHGLGNEQGGFEAASADIDWSDTIDRLFRTLLSDQDLDGNECRIYAASPARRAAQLAPRLLFRGVVQRAALSSPLTARLTVVDPLFADGAPLGPDRQWPPLIPKFTSIGNMTADTLSTPLPVIYGEKSDEGAINPVTGAFAKKGVVPLIYLGTATVGEVDENQPGTYTIDDTIPQPFMFNANNLGTGTTENPGFLTSIYYYGATQRISDGAISEITGPGLLDPEGNSMPGVHFIINFAFADGYNEPNPAYQYIFWASGNSAFHPITNFNAGGQLGITIHDGVTRDSYYDHGDVVDASAVMLPNYTAPDVPNNTWDAYLVCWGASYRGLSLYGSNLGNGDPEAKHDRVELTVADVNGSSVLWPWNADGTVSDAWPFNDTFLDLDAEDGTTYRLTMMFARGPLSDDHKDGVVNFAANMIGIEETGDGTGLPIMEVHIAQHHWLENFVLNRWTSGNWCTAGTSPTWADGTFKVRSSRFFSRQAYTAAAIGGGGLLVNWIADASRGLMDWVKEWNFSTETKLGVNGHGQLTLGFLDDRESPSTWTHIQHIRDIFGPVTATFGENRENWVRGDCDYDSDFQKFREPLQDFKSTVGYQKYKNRWKAGDVLHTSILGYKDQWAWVLQKRLDRLYLGEVNVSIEGPMGWFDTDVDVAGLRLTSHEGRGASGYVEQEMWLRRRRFSLASRTMTYTLVDVGDVPLGFRFRNVTTEALALGDSTPIARLNPQPISLSETLHVTESANGRENPSDTAAQTQSIRISEFLSVARV